MAPAAPPLLLLVGKNRTVGGAELGDDAAQEGRRVAERAHDVQEGPAVEAEAGELLYLVHGGEAADQLVVAGAGEVDEPALPAAALDGAHHPVALLPQLEHAGYELGRVLEVAAHGDGAVARGLT